MADVLYRVSMKFANFGMLVRDGVVIDVATVAYWAKRKLVKDVIAWVEENGGTWKVVSEGDDAPREEFVDAYVSACPSVPPEKAEKVFDALVDENTGVFRRLSEAIKAVREGDEPDRG